jgi:hypothetical protein
MANNKPEDASADSQQESDQQSGDSDQPTAQSDEQAADQSDQSTEQSDQEPAASDQQPEQSEEQPAEGDEAGAQTADQPTDQSQEQPAEGDQPAAEAQEQPADSDQPVTSESGTDTVALADAPASMASTGGAQARPGRQPTRPSRAPARHDFAVRFTFGTTEAGLLAKGLYLFEITAADGSRLAAHAWSSVSVTVPEDFKFSLSQVTRSGEKSPSFDFHVELRWLPFSTTSSGTPVDANDSDYADMIQRDFRIVTTLRPKDNDDTYLIIPPPKGTAVTKIDLHSTIGIVDDAVSAASTNENDFITALMNRGVDLERLVEKGPPQQTKDGKFLYEVKYYGGASIKAATVLP